MMSNQLTAASLVLVLLLTSGEYPTKYTEVFLIASEAAEAQRRCYQCNSYRDGARGPLCHSPMAPNVSTVLCSSNEVCSTVSYITGKFSCKGNSMADLVFQAKSWLLPERANRAWKPAAALKVIFGQHIQIWADSTVQHAHQTTAIPQGKLAFQWCLL